MTNYSRQVLHLDLAKRKSSFGAYADLGILLGGLGTGLSLLGQFKDQNPTVFSIGPLNGYFPFISKVCLLSLDANKVSESYLSGRIGLMMRFSGIDCLVVTGTSSTPVRVSIYPGGVVEYFDGESAQENFSKSGISGQRTSLSFGPEQSLSDDYFQIQGEVGRKFYLDNLLGLNISGDTSLTISKLPDYEELYLDILSKGNLLKVPYDGKISCGGCPAGCDFSPLVEEGFDLVLSHCLVACGFASPIYENVPLIFSCLNSLGLPYKHEDLESLVDRVNHLRKSL